MRPRSNGLSVAFDARASAVEFLRRPRRGGHPANTEESFWANVDRSAGPDACWPWTLRCNPKSGHGFISWAGQDVQTHRLAYSLTHGPIDAGVVVRHSCDNPPCANPAHLVGGTISDNNRDARERGQWQQSYLKPTPGESNVNAKLTDAKVVELRAAWAGGETIKSIADRTGLAVGTVHPMVWGKTWRHVPLVTRQALVRAAEAVAVVRSDWDAIEDGVAAMGGVDEDLLSRAASAIDGAGESGGAF